MADAYLECPPRWKRGTLEPDPTKGMIARVGSGSTPETGVDEFWDGTIPWLTPKEIASRADVPIVSETERLLTEEGLKDSSLTLYPPGTVMLTKRAPVGSVAINSVPMATNQGFLNFTCGPELRPVYLAYWLTVNRPYLDLVANGSTYPELYPSDLFEFEIAVPPPKEQDEIVDLLVSLRYVLHTGFALEQSARDFAEILRIRLENKGILEMRDELLPHLFSGHITPSEVVRMLRPQRRPA